MAELPAPSRVIIVTEDTPAPGTNATQYSICSTHDLAVFTADIVDESNDCAIKPTSILAATQLPTTSQRQELCGCSKVLLKIQKIKIPRCSLVRDGREIPYAKLVQYAFALCDVGNGNTTVSPSLGQLPSSTDIPPVAATDTEPKSHSKVGLIVGVVAGVILVVAIGFILFKRQKSRQNVSKTDSLSLTPRGADAEAYQELSPSNVTPAYPVVTGKVLTTAQSSPVTARSTGGSGDKRASSHSMRASQLSTWDDVLLAVRIPSDSVFVGPLLSRGGYGEVYKGTYRGETVAIKRLLPERRKDLAQVDALLSEAKLMSTLEHERIVTFIGVAWNALSDACVIVEYMENGDLRSVLTKWQSEEMRPHGFDADKVKIAFHVAHALAYLHSLQPVVVHRDLKSKNILLDTNYDAKVTDFGVSRERADSTMTGGIGTSLWMAPEVMLGERYDEKADMFSFGVVLSELDTHKLPYADAKQATADHTIPDSAILQLVSLGRLEVSFTELAHPDLAQLGHDCVQLDPSCRPSAASALHRISEILRRDFSWEPTH